MSKRSDKFLLEDIIESIDKIQKYTKNLSKDDFKEDDMRLDAVVRNFEIIGEAANRLSHEIQKEYQTVQWKRIIGFRNRIVHEYFGIDIEILWSIIENNLEDLKMKISEIIEGNQ
ncbi:MAG: DUF86 domain-containing protein [Saprospiraceae bacterium]|nr:DUF86 domain-containing protein [Saprospiraceae bacterium]MCB9325206.1 DUF86 domain-containing protein [Lewinellaceae bacterium]